MKSLAVADRYGWTRFVAHQVYYSLIGREYEWELMPLALDQKVGALIWSPLGWGRLTGRIRRGQPLPEVSRLHSIADGGPQMPDEYLYTVVDALDKVAESGGGDREDGTAGGTQLAIAKADGLIGDCGRAK
jgi:aryl-alcohol dehydrogenase-like predicted oxidoreductase